MTELEPSTTSIGATLVLADGPADGVNGIQHLEDEIEGKGPTAADLPHNKNIPRRKSDTHKRRKDWNLLADRVSRGDNEDT
jgi:hypothetical protein